MEGVHNNHLPNSYFPLESIRPNQSNNLNGLNRNSLCKNQVKSVKSKINQLMITVSLSKNFDYKQFKIISSISPQQWINNQEQLLRRIRDDKKLYQKFFSLFYKNHLTIANWYLLAIRQKSQIQPYVFKQLFHHKKNDLAVQQSFNNERLKQSIRTNNNKKKSFQIPQNPSSPYHNEQRKKSIISSHSNCLNDSNNNGQSENVSFMKPTFVPIGLRKYQSKTKQSYQSQTLSQKKEQLMGVFFNNLLEINQMEHKRKPLNLNLYKKKKQSVDSHDLYMKTFDACNGRKYIFYDYEKHMQGLKQKTKYNDCVRKGFSDSNVQNYIQNQQTLQASNSSKRINKYQQFEEFKLMQQKQKCSLLPINTVLNQKDLNNYKRLKKVVSENKSSKMVFVNHQGKPITYYIKQERKTDCNLKMNRKNIRNTTTVDDDPIELMAKMSNSVTMR